MSRTFTVAIPLPESAADDPSEQELRIIAQETAEVHASAAGTTAGLVVLVEIQPGLYSKDGLHVHDETGLLARRTAIFTAECHEVAA